MESINALKNTDKKKKVGIEMLLYDLLNKTEASNDPSYLHSQESHDDGVDCTQNPLRVEGLCGAIHLLEEEI